MDMTNKEDAARLLRRLKQDHVDFTRSRDRAQKALDRVTVDLGTVERNIAESGVLSKEEISEILDTKVS